MAYSTISVEGGLFPADLLERIATGRVEGQTWREFFSDQAPSGRLGDEIEQAFSDVREYWNTFQRRQAYSHESLTSLTRGAWIIPLLERLGFELVRQPSAAVVGGESYFVSHRAGSDPDAPPVHIVGIDQSLDQRGEWARRSPHALVQEFLNRSDALWGIVTNGRQLRLLRDLARLSRPTYVELDLEALVQGNLYSEFVLFYRLLHRSRFPRGSADAPDCWLEKYYQQGIDEGGRVRERLREGVEAALRELGSAFLRHPASEALRSALHSGALADEGYYRELLRLIYRILFLMVVEERKLIFPPDATNLERQRIYTDFYSIGRLRDRCERYFAEDPHDDLWPGLLQTFQIFRHDDLARQLGLSALDGELFGGRACPHVESARCTNISLLRAIYQLSTFEDEQKIRRRVNYAGLDVEELGSVYEALLEYRPHVDRPLTPSAVAAPPLPLVAGEGPEVRASFHFDLLAGSERKTTGSYYTPPDLVRVLIDQALGPVLEARRGNEAAILGIRVCDPAAGSGHFLLAAARRIGRELARVRSGEDEPTPEHYRQAVRDVIRTCIYAVDKNPLAVDLCKVALWIEGYNAGLPLNFLDHHVRCGDSLVGVFDLKVLNEGIPDDAYTPVSGDDKATASALKKRNRAERVGQLALDLTGAGQYTPRDLADDFDALAALDDRSPSEVTTKAELYESLRGRGTVWYTYKVACDLWTAAFFLPFQPTSQSEASQITTETIRQALAHPNAVHGALAGTAIGLAETHPFFHWPLEFPEVFRDGGFDVVLGNPPWERIKLQEEEFFAGSDPAIAHAPNAATRKALIKQLPRTNPALAARFAAAKHLAESQSRFIRASGRFPLCGRGDINTYSVSAEAMRQLLGPIGRAGIIVPTGIATDDTNKYFFQSIVESEALVSLYDFENREGIFPGVHRSYKFCLLALSGANRPVSRGAEFAFFLQRVDELRDPERRFTLTKADLALLNPNTRTCPIFRTRRDAELTKAIYRRVPVLVREGDPNGNPWGISFQRMFDMSNDSYLFRTREQLERDGWRLRGNVFERGEERYLPLYEGKMVDAFDHRAASVETIVENLKRPGQPREISEADHQNPYCLPLPQYWVCESDVRSNLPKSDFLLAFKSVTSPTNERTMIASMVPLAGVTNSLIVLDLQSDADDLASQSAMLLANLDGFSLDYVAKQKVGGVNLNFFFVKQFPLLTPMAYMRPCPWHFDRTISDWIKLAVVELTYTSYDLATFARDLGYDGPPFRWDEERRFLIRCELDAAFFHLYGIERDDVDYIMETFPIVKRKDAARYGCYRTKEQILAIYDAMRRAMDGGGSYETILDPPPGDRRAAHNEIGGA